MRELRELRTCIEDTVTCLSRGGQLHCWTRQKSVQLAMVFRLSSDSRQNCEISCPQIHQVILVLLSGADTEGSECLLIANCLEMKVAGN
jgi:hypothetical protein